MHRTLTAIAIGVLSAAIVAETPAREAFTTVVLAQSATAAAGRSVIQGNSLTALGGPLPNASLRLRDIRSGRLVQETTSDEAGVFTFKHVNPGTYIVELLSDKQIVLATSDILIVDDDRLVATVVKLPMRMPVSGLLDGGKGALVIITAAAASAGLLATSTVGQPVSPVR